MAGVTRRCKYKYYKSSGDCPFRRPPYYCSSADPICQDYWYVKKNLGLRTRRANVLKVYVQKTPYAPLNDIHPIIIHEIYFFLSPIKLCCTSLIILKAFLSITKITNIFFYYEKHIICFTELLPKQTIRKSIFADYLINYDIYFC